MATTREPAVLRFLRHLAIRHQFAELSDGELLQRFLKQREEEALVVLMRRHGAMVYRVCLQVLHNEHDAEDAFQATFLILSHKGPSVKRQPSLGGWLFGVARHVAINLKRSQVRRRARESQVGQPDGIDPLSTLLLRDAQAILNEELAGLPDRYRAPLVLCGLEGLTRDEAAQRLGLPLRTLKSRLENARKRLRARLAARGLLPAGALAAAFLGEQTASATMPAALCPSTIQTVSALAAGRPITEIASVQVATLTREVLRTMSMLKLKVAALLVLAAGVLAVGGGLVTMQSLAAQKTGVDSGFATTPRRITGEKSSKPTQLAPQITYRMGEVVRPHFFVRNMGKSTLRIDVPRIITHSYYKQLRLTDAKGKEIPIKKSQEPGGPVGWLASQLDKGQHVEIQGLNLSTGPPASKESVEIVLPVKPGKTYRLQYTLDNYGDPKLGTLKTGEFTFAVVAKDASRPKHPTVQKMEKHIAWGKPGKNDLQAGVVLWPVQDAKPATNRSEG